ncbi:MAG: MFS transporter [Nitrososphaerales archaeon]|nr:MFS transporter [Nitrososphaerales archaeon]
MAEGARPSYRKVLSNHSMFFLWAGEIVSQSGDYVFAIALPWLVLLQTGSAFYVSLTSAIAWTPLLLSPIAGVYVDRTNRKTSVILGNLVQGSAAVTMAVLYAAGALSLPALLALVFVIYFFDQFVSTAIDAILPRLVESKSELAAVNALFSISSSTNRIAGYVVGGTVIALAGVEVPILYDGTTFLFAALLTFAFVSSLYGRISRPPNKSNDPDIHTMGFKAEFVEGARFVKKNRLFLELTVVVFVVNFFVSGPSALIAPYVADSLHLGSLGFGIVVGALGAGGIVGSYVFGKLNVRGYVGRLFFAMALLIGVSLLIMGLIPSFYLSSLLLFVIGLAGVLVNLPIMTLIQAKVPNEMLGRVLAILVTLMSAAAPVAAIVAGGLAVVASTHAVFAYFGMGAVLTVLPSYAMFRELRSASY